MKHEQMNEAQRLYFQTELSNAQIAQTVGVSRRTLLYWVAENNWERLRVSASAMPSLITEKVYHIMDQLTDQLLAPERNGAPITREEVDNLHKLSITICKMKSRTALNESMEMFANFTDSLRDVAPELAEQLAPHIDNYITSRASVSSKRFRAERIANMERTATAKRQDATEEELDAEDLRAWAAQGIVFPDDETVNASASANTKNTPAATPAPKEKFDIRKHLRGTSTKGPGKSFHQQKQTAA